MLFASFVRQIRWRCLKMEVSECEVLLMVIFRHLGKREEMCNESWSYPHYKWTTHDAYNRFDSTQLLLLPPQDQKHHLLICVNLPRKSTVTTKTKYEAISRDCGPCDHRARPPSFWRWHGRSRCPELRQRTKASDWSKVGVSALLKLKAMRQDREGRKEHCKIASLAHKTHEREERSSYVFSRERRDPKGALRTGEVSLSPKYENTNHIKRLKERFEEHEARNAPMPWLSMSCPQSAYATPYHPTVPQLSLYTPPPFPLHPPMVLTRRTMTTTMSHEVHMGATKLSHFHYTCPQHQRHSTPHRSAPTSTPSPAPAPTQTKTQTWMPRHAILTPRNTTLTWKVNTRMDCTRLWD